MRETYCVIMAGGIGSRFWPLSTNEFPKQFHDILGTGESLLQMTFSRLRKLTHADKILVVTHNNYLDLVSKQLPDLPVENIICEPARRNTAPCITYAAYRIQSMNPDANMLVAPSDHLITDSEEFIRICKLGLDFASTSDQLITLGIKPHRPDTGYGYIQFHSESKSDEEIKKVKTFTEKPSLELAKDFLASGDFLWNSGLFIWSLKSFKAELKKHQEELFNTFDEGANVFGTSEEKEFIDTIYPQCDNESIDFGLMEKSSAVYVIPSDFGWSDLGTWGSLYEQSSKDQHNNAVTGKQVLLYDSEFNIVKATGEKTMVIDGLKDYIVVDTPSALLICRKENEQMIKSYVNDIKINFSIKS